MTRYYRHPVHLYAADADKDSNNRTSGSVPDPPEEETVDEIKETIEPVLNAYGYKKLYYDILRTGRKLWISVYITFDKDLVSITRFKIVQNFCIQALAKKYTDFYFELLPDIVFTTDDEALTNHIVSQSEEVDQNAEFTD